MRPVTSRSSSSAASATSGGSWCRSAAARTPSWRSASRPRSVAGFDAEVDALHVVAPDLDPTLRSQAERALAMFVRQHAGEAPRAGRCRWHGCRRDDPARGRDARTWSSWAPRAAGGGAGRDRCWASCPRRSRSRRGPRSSSCAPARRPPAPRSSSAPHRRRPSRQPSAPRPPAGASPRWSGRWFAESSFHHAEFADLRAPRRAQGEAGPDHLGRAAHAQRGGHHRAHRAGRAHRADGEGPAHRRAAGHRLRLRRTTPASSPTAEGARVVRHPEVLPRYGSYVGKGEALWKSLYETSGDLVAWSDTDIRDWHPRFLYGTLGPLLTEPRIGYVKAYYQRPIVAGRPDEGGRRRTRHGARGAAAHQPLLSGAVGLHPATRGRVRGAPGAPRAHPVLHRLCRGDRPPHRPRGAASASTASARWTWTSGSIATRSWRASRR